MPQQSLPRRRLLALTAGLLALPLLAACGRKAAIEPPEGEEEAYTRRVYPDPATQVPPLPETVAEPPEPQLPGPAFGRERTTTTIIQ